MRQKKSKSAKKKPASEKSKKVGSTDSKDNSSNKKAFEDKKQPALEVNQKKEVPRRLMFSRIFSRKKSGLKILEEKAEQEKSASEKKKKLEAKKKSAKNVRQKLKDIKNREKKRSKIYTKKELQQNIIKAGLSATPEQVHKGVLLYSFMIAVSALVILSIYLSRIDLLNTKYFLILLASFMTLGLGLIYGISWLIYHEVLDYKIYQRKKEVEEVLADFLLLTSANVRAGMTIDKALWHAVRPRFGVLAKEIETVAKKTLSGENLEVALNDFGNSYDSALLKRSVSLLIEGIEAGGEIGDLLNNIALDIQETNLMKKEMSSSVTTYAIFISFASTMAAPFLFALAGQILKVVTKIGSRIGTSPQSMQNSGGFQFSFSGGGAIKYGNFIIFAVSTLVTTSIISQIIVATIRKGDAKEAVMNIPITIAVSLTLFFVIGHFLGVFLGGMIS